MTRVIGIWSVAIAMLGVQASALSAAAAPNGYGADRDGDSNPATSTDLAPKIGDPSEAAFDPPYQVITFEAPPGHHGEVLRKQYKKEFGVTFSRGLNREICEGQRYFQYDTRCTYLAAPSGAFAAFYGDEYNRPLRVRFDQPVCAIALGVIPTGGEEGELFEVTLQPYNENGDALAKQTSTFKWTTHTYRWRQMSEAIITDPDVKRVDIGLLSKKPGNGDNQINFLIDDLAFVDEKCDALLDKINAGQQPELDGESIVLVPLSEEVEIVTPLIGPEIDDIEIEIETTIDETLEAEETVEGS